MARKIRIFSQLLFIVLFCVFLFFFNSPNFVNNIRVEWFLRINPLVGLVTSIASRAIVVPLLAGGITLALFTIFFGRIFCGYICPMGTLIDFTDRFVTVRIRSKFKRPPIWLRQLKYIILVVILTWSVFGTVIPSLIDPVSLLTRICVLVLHPILLSIKSVFEELWIIVLGIFDKDAKLNNEMIKLLDVNISAMLIALLIITGGVWDKRFWCQYVCPSGAFLAILGRFSVFRRRVIAKKCNHCGICAKVCPTRAIDVNNCSNTSISECLLCGLCSNRKISCSRLGFELTKPGKSSGVDIQRRHFVYGVAAGVTVAPIINAGVYSKKKGTDVIRPPGAISEKDFLTRCLACGECIKVCPTDALAPCSVFDGFGRMWTPRLIAQNGYCKEDCTDCSNVCPTGALTPVARDDKEFIKIGTAIVDNSLCIAWRGVRRCLVCMHMCQYNALTVNRLGEREGPYVNQEICTGCGKCEHYCPVTAKSAISVISFGERRLEPGNPVLSMSKREKILKIRSDGK